MQFFNKRQKLTIKDSTAETQLFTSRSIFALFFIVLFALCLIGRLFYLQIKEHQFYSTLSQQNLLSIIPISPNRGLIYDRNGVLLATNIPSYTLSIIPSNTKNLNQTIAELSKLISLTPDDLKLFRKLVSQYRPHQPVPLKMKLSDQEVARFYVNQYRFPSVSIQTRMMRYYPLSGITSDIVGYVGRINQDELNKVSSNEGGLLPHYLIDDDIGKAGIEKYYENLLRGGTGAQAAETDASGHIVRILKEIPPRAGKDIYLTIDSGMQEEAENALGEESGSVVVIQPDTGQVLALVTKPNFDPNPFTTGISHAEYQKLLNSPERPLYNRAIRGHFSPGSTIKPFYALFYLDDDVVSPQTQIHDPGWFQLPNASHVYHDWLKNGHGVVNISKAITISCDVFFYTFAVKAGIKHLDNILANYGFGEQTGIDLPEESPGLLPTPAWKMKRFGQQWYEGDTVVMGIGQGMLTVTPLQLAEGVSTIAERGSRFTPHLLLKSVDTLGQTTFEKPIPKMPIILKNSHNWDIVIHAMQEVVNSGTAHSLDRPPDITIAGKTGTQQVYSGSGQDSSRPKKLRNNHYFIAFAPVEHPEIAVAVMVEHSPAIGVAGQVIRYYFERYHPTTPSTPNTPDASGISNTPDTTPDILEPLHKIIKPTEPND